MRRRLSGSFIALAALLTLSACLPQGLQMDRAAAGRQDRSRAMADGLVAGYRALEQYERFYTFNLNAAGYFGQRAQAAAAGNAVNPANPDPALLPPAVLEEIDGARRKLVSAMMAVGTEPKRLAEAQVNFDCWLMREHGRDRIGDMPTSPWCRERFYAALGGIDLDSSRTYEIAFAVSTAVPDNLALETIREAAAIVPDDGNWRVHVTGRADKSGSKQKNLLLSMRRAVAVRNALIQNGVSPDIISIGATGGKPDGEGRSVDILIAPAGTEMPDDDDEIRKIAPHYFDADEPDV